MKTKIMLSGDFRTRLASALEDVRFRDHEIIIMHYNEPVAKLSGLNAEEISKIKEEMNK